GVAAGLPPALKRLPDALRAGVRTSAPPTVTRSRTVLVVAQIACAVMLLVASGLMVRSIVRLSRGSPGFSAEPVLTFRLSLDGDRYGAAAGRAGFVADLLRRFAAAPGVERAAATSRLPLGGARGANGVDIEGRPARRGELRIVDQRHVTPEYFRSMNIALLRG